MTEDEEACIAALLECWFGAPGTPEHDTPRDIWFEADPAFDALLGERFGRHQQRAAAGAYDHWLERCDAAMALALLLDQLPRNLHRGRPEAFASDARAREAARAAIARGFDQQVPPVRRCFFYLPFEHSETLADQELALALFGSLPPGAERDLQLLYAQRHHDIIARFGRFPHRNRILRRASTPEEEAFLAEPNSSFG